MAGSARSIGFTRLIAIFTVLMLACLAVLALPVATYAAGTYHVAVIGDDSTADGSSAYPFKTVQKAVDWAGAHGGGVVSVGIGIFSGDVTMTVAGVSLEGAGASLTVLRGDGINSVIHLSNIAAGSNISGFTITGGKGVGAGIFCGTSSPTIANNTITGNAGGNGGGIYCYDNATPTITDNTITGNTGGGISCEYGSPPAITDNAISSNTGVAIWCYSSSPVITGNTISGNSGGAITLLSFSSPAITDNIINGNTGSGVSCNYYSSPAITGNTITDNTGANGGGVYTASSDCRPKITNDLIVGNSATSYGGGIYLTATVPLVSNDTIADNSASNPGGGIYCASGTQLIANCIVWDNSTDLAGCSATYSDISVGGGGTRDISSDPGFVAPFGGDFHLSAGSPCIDEASPTVAPTTDKDGIVRPWGSGVDMGAYEYYVPTFHTATSLSAPSSDKVKKSLKLSGTVSPTSASPYAAPGKVTIAMTRKVGKKWKSAGSVKITLSGGTFTYSFKPKYKGSWHFAASYSGGVVGPTTYLSSRSGVKGVTVK